MASERRVIEHIVLFNVKEGAAQEEINAWLSALNALDSLECVEYLRATPAVATNSSNKFTHALYGRYRSREALAQYSDHPCHVAVVQGHRVVEDKLALDWEAPEDRSWFESCHALRIELLKPRLDLEQAERTEASEVLSGYNLFPRVLSASFGENISPERAKGFGWGFLCAFRAFDDLQELSNNEEHVRIHEDKVIPKVQETLIMECRLEIL
ncbi:hypothetical protein SUGI_0448100 [Cryptomeria japonica]|uniref:stress-response A/B barrel domain-containing protein UP3-like n=1 Tax=Cryptomeria japonica TaxID=3369 RepID=UPI002408DAA7|nr:stress-response A/B barrel domain-containing protein UP3-like [Cryptomeria japonica]GLJ23665.1 hypothetical protein SUGI_0448100 [Cryptomeria japonica]